MAKRRLVVDTSVLVAVLSNEPHRTALLKVTEGAELVGPSSLPIELGNALSAMFKRGRVSLENAIAILDAFEQISIRLLPIDLHQALELSHRLDIYAYDAYLISCGLRQGCALVTLDRGLLAAARRAGLETLEVSSL